MNKIHKNKNGFTVVEGLLIILILAVLGGVGYMVYHNDHRTKVAAASSTVSKSSTLKSTIKPTTATTTNPYAGWKSYSVNGITFKYPSNWQINSGNDSVNTDISISSIPYQPIITSAQNLTQYNNNVILYLMISNGSNIVYDSPSSEPLGGIVVQSNLEINGSSYCLIGTNAGQTKSGASYSALNQISAIQCDSSARKQESSLSTSYSGKDYDFNITIESGNPESTLPIDQNSSDYSTIKLVLASMKF